MRKLKAIVKDPFKSKQKVFSHDPERKKEFIKLVNLSPKESVKGGDPKRRGVCARVREVRLANNMTQEEFAQAINCSLASLKQIERAFFSPNLRILQAIKYRFHTNYTWLIEGVDNPKD